MKVRGLDRRNVGSSGSLYVDHLDAVLMARTSLMTRRGQAIPLVEQRQRRADSLVTTLEKLGLERRAARVLSPSDYVRDKYGPESTAADGQERTASGRGCARASAPTVPTDFEPDRTAPATPACAGRAGARGVRRAWQRGLSEPSAARADGAEHRRAR